MTTPTPLPCPFCGSAARLESLSCESWMVKHGGDPSPRYFVECWGRGCRAHLWLADSKADAVAAWNKAPREAQPDHLAERLRNARRRGRRVLARRRSR